MAKNQNTFEKRRREVEKKRKAQEKRDRRRKKKEGVEETPADEISSADDSAPTSG